MGPWPGKRNLEFAESYSSEVYGAELTEMKLHALRKPTEHRGYPVQPVQPSSNVTSIGNANHKSDMRAETNIERIVNDLNMESHELSRAAGTSKFHTLDTPSENEPTIGNRDPTKFATPEFVIKLFTLNSLQTVAFKEIARRLLPRICSGKGEAKLKHAPFTMYIGGEGGSGKSRIIEAISYLARSWGCPGAVRTCAPTGIAATLVKGQTFHSFAKIFGRGTKTNRRRQTKLFELVEQFQDLYLLFVDEVSMLARKFVGKLDSVLRDVKENPNSRFGNVMVVFGGDFFQIPPVGTDPVYINPNESKYKSTLEDQIGFEIWTKHLDSVVILQKNMRQAGDEEYAKLLKRLRYGNLSSRDIDLLNERVIDHRSLVDLSSDMFQYTQETKRSLSAIPMVVKTNELRNALNWQCVRSIARHHQITPIVCVADIQAVTKTQFSRRDLHALIAANDTQTGNLPVLLPLLPRMPVRITQNIAVEIGIANGTQGVLVGVQFDPSTTFESAMISEVACLVPSKLPTAAFVELNNTSVIFNERFKTIPKTCSDHTVPLIPFQIPNCTANLRNVRLDAGTKIRIKQLPFVPSYASTTYKVQGATTSGIICFPLLKASGGKVPPAALYVVLSRVKTRKGLHLIERITREHCEYFKPSNTLLAEDMRLRHLHHETMCHYLISEQR